MRRTQAEQPTSMARAMLFSIALHTILVTLALVLLHWSPHKDIKEDKLVMELFGMVANRQMEAQVAAENQPTPQQQTTVQQPQKAEQKAQKKAPKTNVVESPVHIAEQTKQAEQKAAQAVAVPTTPAINSESQKQQTVNDQESEYQMLKRYLTKMKQKIKSHLVYPEDLKKMEYEGIPAVKFTVMETGAILPGSLVLARSSGYPVIDDLALKTVRASAPFDPPDKQRTAVFELDFFRQK